jgi:hypothetical protein
MHKLVDYELVEISPRIFALIIKDGYQRAMLFLRCQEYYESNFSEIRGKNFDLFEYMEIYRKRKGSGVFTYPNDWSGFNVPGQIIENCINDVFCQNSGLLPTGYDYIMESVISQIKGKIKPNNRWYLLGADKESSKIMEHEMCHALYYTNSKYRKEKSSMIKEMHEVISQKMRGILLNMGYCKGVLNDEIQAYLSTGLTVEMLKIRGIKKHQKEFRKHFLKYRETKKA